jgi:hypothetical protein
MRPSVPDIHITDSQDAEFAAYRALPSQAVVGLLLGLLSPVAWLDPFFWFPRWACSSASGPCGESDETPRP